MDRRHFIRSSLTVAAAAGAGSALPLPPVFGQTDPKSRVVIIRNTDMRDETDENRIKQILTRMVHEGVRVLAGGNKSPEEAWRQFLTPKDIVGVKINGISPPLTSHPAIASAIVEGAGFCGIAANNVVAFDKEDIDMIRSGFELNRGGEGMQAYGTWSNEPGFMGYEERQTVRGDTAYHLSRIVSRHCTALVNVPVIKEHFYAGMTCALKNHFGCIDNPNMFHKVDHCGPAIVAVNKDADIRGKQRLIICDARAFQWEQGPSFKPQFIQPYYCLLFSTDPVAIDTIAMEIIDMCRTENGLPKLMERDGADASKGEQSLVGPTAPAAPIHIPEAARAGLGTNDRSRVELIVKDLSSKAPAST